MDPKMKVVMFMIAVSVILACAVSLMYVFGLTYPGQGCGGSSLYRRSDNKCFSAIDCMENPNKCVVWKFNSPFCGNYNSTTRICIA